MRNWPVQKQTHRRAQKHAEHKDATDLYKDCILCFLDFSFLIFY